jgi:hypothetical protein
MGPILIALIELTIMIIFACYLLYRDLKNKD